MKKLFKPTKWVFFLKFELHFAKKSYSTNKAKKKYRITRKKYEIAKRNNTLIIENYNVLVNIVNKIPKIKKISQ